MVKSIGWAHKVMKDDAEVRRLFLEFFQASLLFKSSLTLTNLESIYEWTESLEELKEALWENHVGS